MIQITFKGKRKGGDEWLEGDLNHIDGAVYIFDRREGTGYELNSPDFFGVEPETVGIVQGCRNCGMEDCESKVERKFEGTRLSSFRIGYCDKWEAKQ